ncbi:MAG: NTP transferase domain-containing protein, partial [Gammaproteobacteria bacterium]
MPDRNLTTAAELFGLVLAGGSSRRMGTDKGRLDYHGESQAVWAERLLSAVCESTFVSVNDEQSQKTPYRDLPTIVDTESVGGPARGLLSARARYPLAAWLVIGV